MTSSQERMLLSSARVRLEFAGLHLKEAIKTHVEVPVDRGGRIDFERGAWLKACAEVFILRPAERLA